MEFSPKKAGRQKNALDAEQEGNEISVKFMAYKHVPLGFEMVIEKKKWTEVTRAWNLWWNVGVMTDDPETWDNEIKLINEMQSRLGELTVDQRLIRAQMAEFCRRHPLFPRSIDILCKEIGDGRFSKPVKIGCEGRGLLDSLGYHDSQSLNDQRKELFKEYARSLKKWLVQGHPENPVEYKVFRFLGQSTNVKEAFAEKLISVIDSEEPSISSLKKLCGDECRKTHGKSIFETDWIPFPFGCFKCQEGCPEGASIPNCQCCDSMILDSGLLCVGTFGEKTIPIIIKRGDPLAREFRRFIEENILVYAIAINSWLKEVPLKQITSLKIDALKIAKRVHSSLGDKDEAKEWLAACLLKTIKDNQKRAPEDGVRRTELVDDFTEATSWFQREP